MDIINKRIFPDTITISKSNFDNHGFSSHELFMIKPADKKGLVGNVPYRALLPKGYDGILVTGLGMSAHGDAMPVLRMQPDVQNHGYAAGMASAMAAEEASSVREISVIELQRKLAEKGILPRSLINAEDSYPLSDTELKQAINTLGEDYTGIAVILAHPKRSLSLLKSSWRDAKTEAVKVKYAHVLGMMYDASGSQTLIDKVQKSTWDKGWNFRGMGQFGATTSPLDNLIIALGRTGDKAALPIIIAKLNDLTQKSEFSHCRAVAKALEGFNDPVAAHPLAELLKKPGIMGHTFREIHSTISRTPASPVDDSTRNNSLRELILARALYRCGDYEGLGERILKEYANDYRGHYATHAKAVLAE
jgi:hypothetical protein